MTFNNKRLMTLMISILLLLCLLVGCNNASYKNSRFITLPEYMNIEIDYDLIKVTQQKLDKEIAMFLDKYAVETILKKGNVQDKDVANIDYSGTVDNKPFEGGAGLDYDLTIGSNSFLEGFEQALIGKAIGEVSKILITFPSNHKDSEGNVSKLAGKEAVFIVTVNNVTRRIPPNYTDEFVKSLDIGYSSVEQYNEFLKGEILTYNKTQTVWNSIMETVQVKKYPNTVQKRVDTIRKYYEYLKNYYGYDSFNEFCLDALGQTEEEFDKTNLESARDGVKQEMVSQTIAKLEGITLSKSEITDGLENYAEYYNYENLKEFLKDYDEESIKSSILLNKVMEYLADNAVIINQD